MAKEYFENIRKGYEADEDISDEKWEKIFGKQEEVRNVSKKLQKQKAKEKKEAEEKRAKQKKSGIAMEGEIDGFRDTMDKLTKRLLDTGAKSHKKAQSMARKAAKQYHRQHKKNQQD